jgi:hypothetical protein
MPHRWNRTRVRQCEERVTLLTSCCNSSIDSFIHTHWQCLESKLKHILHLADQDQTWMKLTVYFNNLNYAFLSPQSSLQSWQMCIRKTYYIEAIAINVHSSKDSVLFQIGYNEHSVNAYKNKIWLAWFTASVYTRNDVDETLNYPRLEASHLSRLHRSNFPKTFFCWINSWVLATWMNDSVSLSATYIYL